MPMIHPNITRTKKVGMTNAIRTPRLSFVPVLRFTPAVIPSPKYKPKPTMNSVIAMLTISKGAFSIMCATIELCKDDSARALV